MKIIGWLLLVTISTAKADHLSQAKMTFEKDDKAMNAVYADLKRDLNPHLFLKMQEGQREWVTYRDRVSAMQGGVDPAPSAERWEMAASLTKELVSWLKAWKKLDQRENWAGRYSDGFGGLLQIVVKDGHHYFRLDVVRGPTSHTGEIQGEIRINGNTGWFEVKTAGKEEPTWLTFLNDHEFRGSISLMAENTDHFHGARAYFNGNYVWMGKLAEEEKKELMRAFEGL